MKIKQGKVIPKIILFLISIIFIESQNSTDKTNANSMISTDTIIDSNTKPIEPIKPAEEIKDSETLDVIKNLEKLKEDDFSFKEIPEIIPIITEPIFKEDPCLLKLKNIMSFMPNAEQEAFYQAYLSSKKIRLMRKIKEGAFHQKF